MQKRLTLIMSVCVYLGLLLGCLSSAVIAGVVPPQEAGFSSSVGSSSVAASSVVAPADNSTGNTGKVSLFITGSKPETEVPKVKLSIMAEAAPTVRDLDLTAADTTDFIGEFESALTPEQRGMMMYRSGASRGETLRLTRDDQGREFRITLCAHSPRDTDTVAFRVQDIRFSNDGPSDRIYLTLNGQVLGEYNTGDDYRGGMGWNVFRSTGAVGPVQELRNGNHTLTVRVDTDGWGVELDTLTTRALGQTENKLFMCRAALV